MTSCGGTAHRVSRATDEEDEMAWLGLAKCCLQGDISEMPVVTANLLHTAPSTAAGRCRQAHHYAYAMHHPSAGKLQAACMQHSACMRQIKGNTLYRVGYPVPVVPLLWMRAAILDLDNAIQCNESLALQQHQPAAP
jgi:hypothetical protein